MKRVNWGYVQIACLVGWGICLKLLTAGEPAIPGRERALVSFRLVVGGLCLVGFVVASIMVRRNKSVPSPDDTLDRRLPLGEKSITVTYQNTPTAARRCELYELTNRPQTLLILAGFGLFGAYQIAGRMAMPDVELALMIFPILHFLNTGMLLNLASVLIPVLLRSKFPRPDSVRVCTTSLTEKGFLDETPDKVIPIPWKNIHDIREASGDVFFWKFGGGCYIPREAFADLDETRRYHRAAVGLWRSNGKDWPDDVPAEIDRWHPSPMAPNPEDDNPYASPRAPIHGEFAPDHSSRFARLARWSACLLAIDSVVIICVMWLRVR